MRKNRLENEAEGESAGRAADGAGEAVQVAALTDRRRVVGDVPPDDPAAAESPRPEHTANRSGNVMPIMLLAEKYIGGDVLAREAVFPSAEIQCRSIP